MTVRSLIDQIHDRLLESFSHVNEPQIDPENQTKVLIVTTQASEWQRDATAGDVATIAARAQAIGEAILQEGH